MEDKNAVSRRKFVGGLAAALGYVSTGPDLDVFAQGRAAGQGRPRRWTGRRPQQTAAQYDAMAKLANNENNYGIPDSVMKAMTEHWKYAGRYGYPDPGLNAAIAEFDGVKTENVMVTARLGRSARRRRHDVPAGRQEGARRRAVLQLRVSARHQHQVRSDQAAADQGLPSGHRHDHRRGQEAPGRARVRLHLQPEQPDGRRSSPRTRSSSCSTAFRPACPC